MSNPKLNFKEETSAKKTRSPPEKAKVEQTQPKKKKLKLDTDKAKEKAQHLRFGKAELTPDDLRRLSKEQKREMYAAALARSAAHREIDQYEEDNVGVQALSEGEKAAGNVQEFSKNRYSRKLKKKAKMQAKKKARTTKSSTRQPDKAQNAGDSSVFHGETGEGGSNWLSRWRQKQDMTVVREAAIAAFVPQKFYTVELELTSGCTASSRRISEKDAAENLLAECRKEMISTIQKVARKEKSENPPLLYDLTTLQRDANRLLGYSAQQTLNYVQSLYEKKLTTYPRTDSCYITDDDEEMLAGLTDELEEFLGIAADTADFAVPRTRRTVNRDKVTDHHAILPTRSMLQADLDALPTGERNVLKLIIARTLMAVSKPYRYLETMLTTECAGEEFTAKGKEILEEGWKAVERKVLADILSRKQEFTTLPAMEESECAILSAELKEGHTSPPKHFTDVICYERGIRNRP